MLPGRVLASLIRRCDTAVSCSQCSAWIAAATSSGPPAAAVAVQQWPPPGTTNAFWSTASPLSAAAAAAAAAAATQAPAAAGSSSGSSSTSSSSSGSSSGSSSSSSSSSAGGQQQQQQQQQGLPAAPKLSFDQLHEQYQAQLTLRNIQDESNLLVLISRAHKPEQVQAALTLLRWDKMVRARQQRRYAHFSPTAIRALLKAGRATKLGPGFAVQMLQEADELGLQVSRAACEDVMEQCIDQQDFWAAAEAWIYTKLYCAAPDRGVSSAAAGDAAGDVGSSEQQQQGEGPLAWASVSLMRTYAKGLSGMLQQGCVNEGHEQHVRQQLQQVVQELEGRGALVPKGLRKALDGSLAGAAAAAGAEAAAGTAPVEGTEAVTDSTANADKGVESSSS